MIVKKLRIILVGSLLGGVNLFVLPGHAGLVRLHCSAAYSGLHLSPEGGSFTVVINQRARGKSNANFNCDGQVREVECVNANLCGLELEDGRACSVGSSTDDEGRLRWSGQVILASGASMLVQCR